MHICSWAYNFTIEMGNDVKRYIITGGPGTGKSSIIEELRKRGYYAFDEVSRKVIQEQQEIGGNLFPWNDIEGFVEECYPRMRHDLLESTKYQTSFFDRSIPDLKAYLEYKGKHFDPCLNLHLDAYSTVIFFCPPWEGIFVNDAQRPESFEDCQQISTKLIETYKSLDFEIRLVPKIPLYERILFILNEVKEDKIRDNLRNL